MTISEEVTRWCGARPCEEAQEWLNTRLSLREAIVHCDQRDWLQWAIARVDPEGRAPLWKTYQESVAPFLKVYEEGLKTYQEGQVPLLKVYEDGLRDLLLSKL